MSDEGMSLPSEKEIEAWRRHVRVAGSLPKQVANRLLNIVGEFAARLQDSDVVTVDEWADIYNGLLAEGYAEGDAHELQERLMSLELATLEYLQSTDEEPTDD